MDAPQRFANPLSESRRRGPWVARAGASGGLPVFLTSFVGREDEIVLATSLLQRPDVRLLTLTGPGGIGKTRLAVEIAAASGEHFHDGVPFVPLASVSDPSMVLTAIAAALGLHELDIARIDDIVAASLGDANILLVVDNFEHVTDAAPALTRLLSRCPQLKLLVTSRSLLRVEGEHAIPVPPLALPRTTATLTYDDWLRVPVVRLFIERAEAVDPSLAWNQREILRLVEICERLDGLPLAVELAATRVRHFTLAEINDRLNDLLPLLTGGSRDHPSRLQTMRNAIAWSYRLLSPDVQTLFRRLAVFRGGFTLESVEAVSEYLSGRNSGTESADGHERMVEADGCTSIRDRLSALIDASLLVRDLDTGASTARYRMLETIREYAGEQLTNSGEREPALRAHAIYFTDFAERHEFADLLPDHIRALSELETERDNWRSALSWLEKSSDVERFVRLVAALGSFWLSQANYQEGKAWFERALIADVDSVGRAKIHVQLGMSELFQGDNEAAGPELTKGLAACRAHGEAHHAALALIGLAALAIDRGAFERSTELLRESLLAAGAIADQRLAEIMSGWVSINLAVVARRAGDPDLAETHLGDTLRRFRAREFQVGTMMALGDLGDLASDRGDWTQALTLYKEALTIGKTNPGKRIVIEVIESVAIVAAQTDQLRRSAILLGAAEGLRERIGLRYRQSKSRAALESARIATRSDFAGRNLAAAWDLGRSLSDEQAIAEAMEIIDGVVGPGRTKPLLTGRETEILQMLTTGMTDPEIADALFISTRTVEHHVARIFRKLDVRTRTAATSAAISAGLVAPGAPGTLA